MKKTIKSDAALKVFSVIIAVSLWLYVVQVESPDIERTIKGVPVVFTQKDTLAEKNLILLNDNEHTIDVRINGSRQYAIEVNRENITVLADVSAIEGTGKHTVMTNVVLPYANLQMVSKSPSSLTVDVDQLVTVEKPVEVVTKGSPKDSYVVGALTAEPETVTISGPKTIIDGIQSVAAIVDVSGKSADTAGLMPLTVLGTNNKEIKSQLLTFDTEEIEVRAEILKTKTVALTPDFYEGASGYQLDESSIKEIQVAGVQTLLDTLTSVKTKPFSIYDINERGEVSVELALPQGVKSLDGETFTLRFVLPAQTGNS
ncbi:MAG: hypothetical protein E7414_01765 [Ruminococcaceae bacterium]|nr:hypothetical protein [Oscillospiraceae bacterium]